MTREEAIVMWVIPALENTWNEKRCNEILDALGQEPCDDCISRQAVRHILNHEVKLPIKVWKKVFELVDDLPSVTPAEKVGHWIDVDGIWFKCSECGAHRKMMPAYKEYYCPNCGRKMEVEE